MSPLLFDLYLDSSLKAFDMRREKKTEREKRKWKGETERQYFFL
jgi:hypothetical protein